MYWWVEPLVLKIAQLWMEILFCPLKGKKNISRKNERLSNTVCSVSLFHMLFMCVCF